MTTLKVILGTYRVRELSKVKDNDEENTEFELRKPIEETIKAGS